MKQSEIEKKISPFVKHKVTLCSSIVLEPTCWSSEKKKFYKEGKQFRSFGGGGNHRASVTNHLFEQFLLGFAQQGLSVYATG